jgi:hypothetical protein
MNFSLKYFGSKQGHGIAAQPCSVLLQRGHVSMSARSSSIEARTNDQPVYCTRLLVKNDPVSSTYR